MNDYSYIPPIVKEFTFALDIADVVKAVSDFCRQKYWILEKFSDIRYTAHSRSTAYSLRSRVMLASDCHLEIVGRPISKTTRITAQSLECSQDFADHYPASLHRYHACVDSLLAHLADFEITPDLGPPLAQPEPVNPTDDKRESNGKLYMSNGKPLLKPGQMTVGEYAKTPEGKEWGKLISSTFDDILHPHRAFIDISEHLVEMLKMPDLSKILKIPNLAEVFKRISELEDDPDNQRFIAIVKSLEDSPDIRLQAIGKMLLELPIEDLPAMSQRYLYLVHYADTPQLSLATSPLIKPVPEPVKPVDDVVLALPTKPDDQRLIEATRTEKYRKIIAYTNSGKSPVQISELMNHPPDQINIDLNRIRNSKNLKSLVLPAKRRKSTYQKDDK